VNNLHQLRKIAVSSYSGSSSGFLGGLLKQKRRGKKLKQGKPILHTPT
jgi:hypothetical protein